MKTGAVSCSFFYVTLSLCVCKISLQSPVGLKTSEVNSNVFPPTEWLPNERDPLKVHTRIKRFQGGDTAFSPLVGIIYENNGTRIYPHDPILFHGTKDIHLTREQLIWERIYQILRRRGVGNVPPGLPEQTRNLLLQCVEASRSQTSNRSLPPRCSGLSQGTGSVPPGFGGFQHTHPGFQPYFPSDPFGSGGGSDHTHSSPGQSFIPGLTPNVGHHHGPHGDTRPNLPLPNRFVNQEPYRPHSHQSSPDGNEGAPIFFG